MQTLTLPLFLAAAAMFVLPFVPDSGSELLSDLQPGNNYGPTGASSCIINTIACTALFDSSANI